MRLACCVLEPLFVEAGHDEHTQVDAVLACILARDPSVIGGSNHELTICTLGGQPFGKGLPSDSELLEERIFWREEAALAERDAIREHRRLVALQVEAHVRVRLGGEVGFELLRFEGFARLWQAAARLILTDLVLFFLPGNGVRDDGALVQLRHAHVLQIRHDLWPAFIIL